MKDIEVVHAEAAQRLLEALYQRRAHEQISIRADDAALGGDDHAVARDAFQRPAQHLLVSIGLRGVEKIHSEFECGAHQGNRVVFAFARSQA
jgi:hypothetical protein